MSPPPPHSTLFPYTTLFRSTSTTYAPGCSQDRACPVIGEYEQIPGEYRCAHHLDRTTDPTNRRGQNVVVVQDRKSTRLNSSHSQISYAVFCLKKKMASCTIV